MCPPIEENQQEKESNDLMSKVGYLLEIFLDTAKPVKITLSCKEPKQRLYVDLICSATTRTSVSGFTFPLNFTMLAFCIDFVV